MSRWEVVVSNVGQVESTLDEDRARRVFRDYVRASGFGIGRCAGESVTLLRDGAPVKEHRP